MNDSYKGFQLFNDIEDQALRNRNRAVVLANIAEDNTKRKFLSPKGASLIIGYFDQVDKEDRSDVKDRFETQLKERGFSLG